MLHILNITCFLCFHYCNIHLLVFVLIFAFVCSSSSIYILYVANLASWLQKTTDLVEAGAL